MACYLQAKKLCGTVSLNGDKSISHRALILSLLARGRSTIKNLNKGHDVMHTVQAIRALGANVIFDKEKDITIVDGAGLGCLLQPAAPIYLGNSGTAARLLIGAIAPYNITTEITGDESLQSRPMDRIITPLKLMGAQFSPTNQLPLILLGNPEPIPIEWDLTIASAQVKSALLLAALSISGDNIIREYVQSRDHTERMLPLFEADFTSSQKSNHIALNIVGNKTLHHTELAVIGDFSSASFLMAAALLVPDSYIELKNIGINPTRTGFLTCLQEMGADIELLNKREISSEPVCDIKIRHSQLKGIVVPASRAALMIDEYPIISVLAAFAQGETILHGIEELKIKESNRLVAIAEALQLNNVVCEIKNNSLKITGTSPIHMGNTTVNSRQDHRIAMSFLIMGLASANPIYIDDISSIATSFPEFFRLLATLGAEIYG